jgi:hypothetical protein
MKKDSTKNRPGANFTMPRPVYETVCYGMLQVAVPWHMMKLPVPVH